MNDNERKPIGERMATIEAWSEGHEKICGDRYRLLMGVISVGGSIILAVAGWGVKQAHDDQQDQLHLLQNVSQQVSSTKAQPVTVQMNQPQVAAPVAPAPDGTVQ